MTFAAASRTWTTSPSKRAQSGHSISVVQMEALKRYRTGGEQWVTVQHVTVNEGGQAIVGAVTPPTRRGGV